MNCSLSFIVVLIAMQLVAAGAPQYDKKPASVQIYDRGFSITVSEEREPNVEGVRFEGDLIASNGQKVFSFNEITQAPVDGQWVFNNNEIKVLLGDVINYRVHVIASDIDKVREEHSYTVESLPTTTTTTVRPPTPPPAKPYNTYTQTPSPVYSNPILTVMPSKSQSTLVKQSEVATMYQDIFHSPNTSTKSTSSCNCAATTTPSNADSMISNQLKLILLHVQSSNEKSESILDKVNAMEEILSGLLSERPNISKQLLLKGIPTVPEPSKLLSELRTLITHTLDLPKLAPSVVSAIQVGDDVLFEMKTTIDKLHILYRARNVLDTSAFSIVDYVKYTSPPVVPEHTTPKEMEVPFDVRLGKA